LCKGFGNSIAIFTFTFTLYLCEVTAMSSNLMLLLNFKHFNNFFSGDKLILWMQALQKNGKSFGCAHCIRNFHSLIFLKAYLHAHSAFGYSCVKSSSKNHNILSSIQKFIILRNLSAAHVVRRHFVIIHLSGCTQWFIQVRNLSAVLCVRSLLERRQLSEITQELILERNPFNVQLAKSPLVN